MDLAPIVVLYVQRMKKILLIIGLLGTYGLYAQKVSGYWYGQANVDMAGIQNNYLTELIIAQKGNKVRGFFGYYFKDVYESFLVKGTYDPQTRKIIIRDIPIIYFNTNSTVNSVDCITSFYGTLMVSKVKSTLTGYFFRDKKYEYTCPDLRVTYTLFSEANVEDSVFKDMGVTKLYWQTHPDAQEESASAQAQAVALEAPLKASGKPVVDSAGSTQGMPQVSANLPGRATLAQTGKSNNVSAPAIKTDLVRISEEFRKRKMLPSKELTVSSDSIRLSFYDNAEVDGDSISVFLNNKLIIAHQGLTERAFNVYVKLDSLKETNEVSMFAENLGKYPPNTALMVVNDGDERYEVFLSSDFKGNATVRFKRKKPQ